MTVEAEYGVTQLLAFKMQEGAKEHRQLREAREGKKSDFPLEPPESMQPRQHLDFRPKSPISDF